MLIRLRALGSLIGAAAPVLAGGASAGAATFQVFPVMIEANADTPAGVLTLTNTSQEPVTLQVRLFRWTQVDGRDELQPTNDVVASPPLARMPAGGQHLIRVVRLAKQRPAAEESYRLLVDELPGETQLGSGVRLLLRQSIPVFFGSNGSARPDMAWRIVRGEAGLELAATNGGKRRQRISELVVKDAAGTVLERKPGLVGYILAGSEARWALNTTSAGSAVKIMAASDGGPIDANVAVGPAP